MDPENKVFIDSLKFAYTVDKIMSPYISWREMQAIFRQEFDKFKIDLQSADVTLKTVQERINDKIDKDKIFHTNFINNPLRVILCGVEG